MYGDLQTLEEDVSFYLFLAVCGCEWNNSQNRSETGNCKNVFFDFLHAIFSRSHLIVATLSRLATVKNCHTIVVDHPRLDNQTLMLALLQCTSLPRVVCESVYVVLLFWHFCEFDLYQVCIGTYCTEIAICSHSKLQHD